MITREKLRNEFTFRRPTGTDIALTILFVVLMAVCEALRQLGMKLPAVLLLIGIIIFYTWRMNGRWKELPMLLSMLMLYTAAVCLFFLGNYLILRGYDTPAEFSFMTANVCMRTVLFNVCCNGFYEIREKMQAIRKNKNKE